MADNFDPDDVSPAGVGRRLALTREALGMSQPDLCAKMNAIGGDTYPQKWSNAETGDNYPFPPDLKRFYQVTGASADWILFGLLHRNPESVQKAITDYLKAEAEAADRRRA